MANKKKIQTKEIVKEKRRKRMMIMITTMMMIIILMIMSMIMATIKNEQLDANCACLGAASFFFPMFEIHSNFLTSLFLLQGCTSALWKCLRSAGKVVSLVKNCYKALKACRG